VAFAGMGGLGGWFGMEWEMPCFDFVFFGTVWRGAGEIVLVGRKSGRGQKKDSSYPVGICESERQKRNDGWLESGMLM
jgi:hypothetical protein